MSLAGLLERKELEGLLLGLGIEYEGDVPPEDELRAWMEGQARLRRLTGIPGAFCSPSFVEHPGAT